MGHALRKFYSDLLIAIDENTNMEDSKKMKKGEVDYSVFGGYSLDKEVFEHLLKILPGGSSIIELGSGRASAELAKIWEVYSIEHDEKWVGHFESVRYIQADICNGWYDIESLKKISQKNMIA